MKIHLSSALMLVTTLCGQDSPESRRPMAFALEGVRFQDVGVCEDGGFVALGTFAGQVDFGRGEGGAVLATEDFDSFVCRYTADGRIGWLQRVGRGNRCRIFDGLVTPRGDVTVWGEFSGDLELGAGDHERTLTTAEPVGFLAGFDKDGTLTSARRLPPLVDPPPSLAFGEGFVVVDAQGNAVFGGLAMSRSSRASAGFLTSVGPDGEIRWHRAGSAWTTSVTLDATGRVAAAYELLSEPGPRISRNLGLLCVEPNGREVWRHEFRNDGGRHSLSFGCLARAQGNLVLVAGLSGSVDLDPGPGTHEVQAKGGMVVARYDARGGFVNAFVLDGPGVIFLRPGGVAVDAIGDIYVCGSFAGAIDFDPGKNEHHLEPGTANGGGYFVAKYDPSGQLGWATVGKFVITPEQGDRDNLLTGLAVDRRARQVIAWGFFGNDVELPDGTRIRNPDNTRHGLILRLDRDGAPK
jgi:hypothetical protein